jgi:tetratricopeptide (TPR) repeat protein
VDSTGIEIITGVAKLPPLSLEPAMPEANVAVAADRVVALIVAARAALERRSADGDAVATAALSLAPAWSDDAVRAAWDPSTERQEARSSKPTPGRAGPDAPLAGTAREIRGLYERAQDEIEADRFAFAAILLLPVLHLEAGKADGMVALAICGVHLGNFDAARDLAIECTRLPEKHPRAFSIAGFCELQRGQRKAAQLLLAQAARLARRRPEFREDLRAAQRLLLILHFA